ncbi:MAG: type II secretion system protein [Verrucomicrobiota bacterium]
MKDSSGFTLIELLVAIALIVVLASVLVPSSKALSRAHARRAAISIVMDSMEGAKRSAQVSKKNVWVIFRHTGGKKPDSLRVVTMDGISPVAQGTWLKLPEGIFFKVEDESLMGEPPPKNILLAGLNDLLPLEGESFGSLMFSGYGRILIPKPGGRSLKIDFSSTIGPSPGSITISRGTGRTSYQ